MFRYNANTLKHMEDLLKAAGYTLRYEKGSFKPGFCILENKRVAVVNKFYGMEARINALMEIINHLQITREQLPEDHWKLLEEITAQNASA